MNKQKNEIRKRIIKIRKKISFLRRSIAEKKTLKIATFNYTNILSFASKPNEINLWKLNNTLAKEKRLCLPKIYNNQLKIYHVTDITTQLIKNPNFKVLEPNPNKCQETNLDEISCVLVPGLAFDKYNHRIGYGKGYYDRLLQNMNCPFIGIGFLEQLINQVPKEEHDIKLNHVLLF